ncbi:hypothetical protein [Fulvivirga sp.]|uniref:hypothetical protein n=1 Tax=Fulvivirga sp. TaxID=1931237 RepID=UPI0032EDEA78
MEGYFKIEWIIELIKEQAPNRVELIDNLLQSGIKGWVRQPYVRFVSASNSDWRYIESIALEHKKEGTIILDVLKDDIVGGIEFVDQIPI